MQAQLPRQRRILREFAAGVVHSKSNAAGRYSARQSHRSPWR
jgi:hypothetical protein